MLFRSGHDNAAVNNGAIVVASAGPSGRSVSNVTMSGLTIKNTRVAAARNVGVFTYNGGAVSNIWFKGFNTVGGPKKYFDTNAIGGYSMTDWKVDGVAVPNRTVK